MSILLSLSASNVKGNTKRAIVITMFFIGYCAGCIGSPMLWNNRPRYREGVITAIVTWIVLFFVSLTYRYLCVWDNKKRDDQAALNGHNSRADVVLDKNGAPKWDLTDKEDRMFRYSW